VAQCHGTNVGPMGTLRQGNGNLTGGVPFVAFDRTQASVSGDVAGPLRACGAQAEGVNDGKADVQCVAFAPGNLMRRAGENPNAEVVGTLGAEKQGDMFPHVAYRFDNPSDTCYNQGITHRGGPSNASTQEANAREVLSVLRQKAGEEAFAEWGLGVLDSLRAAEILQPPMHGKGVRGKTEGGESRLENSTRLCTADSQVGTVREVWLTRCLGRASHEWQLEGQLARELGAYLSELSQQGASQASALRDLWQASEGLGLLQQALYPFQEVWRPVGGEDPNTQEVQGLRRTRSCQGTLRQALHAGETGGHLDVDSKNRIQETRGVSFGVRRLTPL